MVVAGGLSLAAAGTRPFSAAADGVTAVALAGAVVVAVAGKRWVRSRAPGRSPRSAPDRPSGWPAGERWLGWPSRSPRWGGN